MTDVVVPRDDADAPEPLPSGLHMLSTPIGAAADITLRGLDALRRADMLAAEDTRTLRKLMDLHAVALRGRPLVAYHDHSPPSARSRLLAALGEGRSVVYASEAGTPLIADPGYRLVAEARAAGHAVRALPGPSAALAALVVSGLPTDAFVFAGFPPPKSAARRRKFASWADAPATLIFYETGPRLAASLADMRDVFGDRRAAVTRELTKRHEDVVDGSLDALAARFAETPVKGEIVVLVDRAARPEADAEALDAFLRRALAEGSVREAAKSAAESLLIPKKIAYERAIEIAHGDQKSNKAVHDGPQRDDG